MMLNTHVFEIALQDLTVFNSPALNNLLKYTFPNMYNYGLIISHLEEQKRIKFLLNWLNILLEQLGVIVTVNHCFYAAKRTVVQ